MIHRALIVLTILALGAASCGSTDQTAVAPDVAETEDTTEGESCTAFDLGADDETEIVVGHLIVDGELGPVCFGESNDSVLEAFEELAIITPPDQMTDLALFAGFNWVGQQDEVTLAYVFPVDEAASQFVMAIEVEEFTNDREIASLTNAHEFAHVFTQTESELDTDTTADECDTYWNDVGCFREDSLMWTWMLEFWDPADLAALDGEATVAGGEQLCSLDNSFFGSYAASNPEEDFAEAFSAYVYGLEAATDGQAEKIAWLAEQPGLSEFRDRADAAGLTPLPNSFDLCG